MHTGTQAHTHIQAHTHACIHTGIVLEIILNPRKNDNLKKFGSSSSKLASDFFNVIADYVTIAGVFSRRIDFL